MKLKYIIPISLCILIILCICALPLPTYINTELTGVGYTENGDEGTAVVVTIQGWQLNYLFFKDQMNLRVEIKPTTTDITIQAASTLISNEILDHPYLALSAYSHSKNSHVFGNMAVNAGLSSCLISGDIAEQLGYAYIGAGIQEGTLSRYLTDFPELD